MASPITEPLSPEAEIALAYSPADRRDRLRSFFLLDQRLAQIIAKTNEPTLGQIRLAWWRDMIGKPLRERPKGDPVLDAIGAHWGGHEASLVPIVDGWEILIAAAELTPAAISEFAWQRGAPLLAIGPPQDEDMGILIGRAAARWALADAAWRMSDPAERALFVDAGLALGTPEKRLPREWRGLAVLDALARRALARGARPLMDGRGAAFVAMRAAFIGA